MENAMNVATFHDRLLEHAYSYRKNQTLKKIEEAARLTHLGMLEVEDMLTWLKLAKEVS